MDYAPEEYTRHYIVQALFKLMNAYDYDKISVTDIAKKAGVGRATFYRYFKNKEDVIYFYFEHSKKRFVFRQRFFPRCREDYLRVATDAMTLFKENKEPFKLLKKARLEYIYLQYLNDNFKETFEADYPDKNPYMPYIYAGILFNVSMAWLENNCEGDTAAIAESIVDAIY